MSEEGKRICSAILFNRKKADPNAGVMVPEVNVKITKDLLECAEIISKYEPDATVMLLATTPIERSILIAEILPSTPVSKGISRHLKNRLLLGDWLNESTKSVCVPGANVTDIKSSDYITIREISYSNTSRENDPEKLVDQVRTNSFCFLRKAGLYVDDSSEEKEYTFDDI